jgi:hypothetical protein
MASGRFLCALDVWFDARTNYLSGPGFTRDEERFRRHWPADIHIVGNDIVRLHAVTGLRRRRRSWGQTFALRFALRIEGVAPRQPTKNAASRPRLDVDFGGAERDRTDDLLSAIQALSQLSYSPTMLELRC